MKNVCQKIEDKLDFCRYKWQENMIFNIFYIANNVVIAKTSFRKSFYFYAILMIKYEAIILVILLTIILIKD